jgi:hypothetical protein
VIKPWTRALAVALLVLTGFAAALIATAWFALPLDGVTVTVHGRSFSLGELQGPQTVVAFCIAVAAVVVAIVAVLAVVLVGLGLGALGIAFGLLTAAASVALVLSPFVLIGWLLWRPLRERPAPVAVSSP